MKLKGNKPHILIVDDDLADQRMILRALENGPVESTQHVCSGGAEALAYLMRAGPPEVAPAAPTPDLVLIDLNMPGIDGRDLLRSMREDCRLQSLPAIVLTTSDDPRDAADSYALGARSYIVKPRSFDELCKTLNRLQQYWFEVVQLPPAP